MFGYGYGCGYGGGEWLWIIIIVFILFILFGNNRQGCCHQQHQCGCSQNCTL